MKKVETSQVNSYDSKLQLGGVNDVESFKVRKGKVDGCVDYFDVAPLVYLENQVAKLNTDHGYKLTTNLSN